MKTLTHGHPAPATPLKAAVIISVPPQSCPWCSEPVEHYEANCFYLDLHWHIQCLDSFWRGCTMAYNHGRFHENTISPA
jgi:hypothetical protein